MALLLLVVLIPAALIPAAAAQQTFRVDSHAAEQPFRVDVNLVNVSFIVRDERGRLVTTLSRDDFEVFEDNHAQNVSFFARSADLPLALGLIADFSGSQRNFLKDHHSDLETFLREVLRPQDRAFLVCFGNRIRLVQDFTNSAGSLLEALRRFEKGERRFPELGPPEEERVLGTAVYDALHHSVTEKLSASDLRRRAVLLFSDGEDNSSAYHLLDAMESIQSAGALFYGLRYTEDNHGRLNARNKYGVRVFSRVAADTGGAHFDARREDLRRHFRQIGEELRSSYELAYHSSNPVRDNTFRNIRIRTKPPGLTVRAKSGYYAR